MQRFKVPKDESSSTPSTSSPTPMPSTLWHYEFGFVRMEYVVILFVLFTLVVVIFAFRKQILRCSKCRTVARQTEVQTVTSTTPDHQHHQHTMRQQQVTFESETPNTRRSNMHRPKKQADDSETPTDTSESHHSCKSPECRRKLSRYQQQERACKRNDAESDSDSPTDATESHQSSKSRNRKRSTQKRNPKQSRDHRANHQHQAQGGKHQGRSGHQKQARASQQQQQARGGQPAQMQQTESRTSPFVINDVQRSPTESHVQTHATRLSSFIYNDF